MKVKFLTDYEGKYGKAPKGREDWVTNVAGKELIADGYVVEVKENIESVEAATKQGRVKEKKKEPVVVNLPSRYDATATDDELNKYTQTSKPEQRPWWRFW